MPGLSAKGLTLRASIAAVVTGEPKVGSVALLCDSWSARLLTP